MAQEQIEQIQQNSIKVKEMVDLIIAQKDCWCHLEELDKYVGTIREYFIANTDLSIDALNRIIFGLPQYLYKALDVLKEVEMDKGLSKEHAVYAKNDAVLTATGTVAEKQAQAENKTAENRITDLAYTTVLNMVKSKIEAANQIWDAAKKVQAAKLKDQAFTGMVGSAVGNF